MPINLTSCRTLLVIVAIFPLIGCSGSPSDSENEPASVEPESSDNPSIPPNDTPLPVDLNATICYPEDCGTNGEQVIYRFEPATRELMAIDTSNGPWWRFPLPGDNQSNTIEHLVRTRENVTIVVRITPATGDAYPEFSVFKGSGDYERTVRLKIDTGTDERLAPTMYDVLGTRWGLIVLGQLQRKQDDNWVDSNSVLAWVDIDTGQTLAWQRLETSRQPQLELGEYRYPFYRIAVNDRGERRNFDHRLLADAGSTAIVDPSNFRSVRMLAGNWIAGNYIVEAKELSDDISTLIAGNPLYYDSASRPTFACPLGGTVTRLAEPIYNIDGFNVGFDACEIANLTLDGGYEHQGYSASSSVRASQTSRDTWKNFRISSGEYHQLKLEGSAETTRIREHGSECDTMNVRNVRTIAISEASILDDNGETRIYDGNYTKTVQENHRPVSDGSCQVFTDETVSADATVFSDIYGLTFTDARFLINLSTSRHFQEEQILADQPHTGQLVVDANDGSSLTTNRNSSSRVNVINLLKGSGSETQLEDLWRIDDLDRW